MFMQLLYAKLEQLNVLPGQSARVKKTTIRFIAGYRPQVNVPR